MTIKHDFLDLDYERLANTYGTPLYIISEDRIEERCEEIKRDFLNRYENTFAAYAGKAFLTKEMCRLLQRQGLGLDVVSGGELYTAMKADFDLNKVIFHGNNKSIEELELAIVNGVGRIVVDHLEEVELINHICEAVGKKAKVLLRITPGISGKTHAYISTGQTDSKFGIPMNVEILHKFLHQRDKYQFVTIAGFHFHIGSQLFENEPYLKATRVLISLIHDLKVNLGFEVSELDIGGGFGIQYLETETRKPLNYYLDPVMDYVNEKCQALNLKRPKVIIEPGRWVVGEAGATLYKVGSIKKIPGVRTYMSVDGGMPDNPRPALYNAQYHAVILNRDAKEYQEKVTVAGKCCESGDLLIKDIMLPDPCRGDLLLVKSTGAYNYSMSSNYNKLPIPAVVMVKDGADRLIVRRQTYDDMLSREL